VLLEPFADARVGGGQLLFGEIVKGVLVISAADKQKDVLQVDSPFKAVLSAASFIRRSAAPRIDIVRSR
jgi:hypothetical protein